jgi:putative sigma-54 modulation protein
MRIDITGRHVEITPALRQLIERRLARVERLLNDSAMSATAILTLEKYRHRTEIIVHARGDKMMRGLGEGNAWTLSIRQAVEKVEQQAKKVKGKWTERKRSDTRRRVPRARGWRRPQRQARGAGTRTGGAAGDPREPLRGEADERRRRGTADGTDDRSVHRLPQSGVGGGQHRLPAQRRQPGPDRAGLNAAAQGRRLALAPGTNIPANDRSHATCGRHRGDGAR